MDEIRLFQTGGRRMRTVEIEKGHVITGTEHSSKGNQLKWELDGYWYKADAFGYESLAETVVSIMLQKSNLDSFVSYEPVWISYRGKRYRGCRSRNFKREKEELVPLERLARTCTGFGLAKELSRISDIRQRILYTVELVENVTGIDGFGEYLTKMLEMDAFFLNEDRHTNNIALLYHVDKKSYRLCPFYDMGLSLFSDTREAYPIDRGFEECRKQIVSKPFSRDFDEQMDAAEELFGDFLRLDLKAGDIDDLIAGLEEAYQLEDGKERLYTRKELERVKETLRYQVGKYRYLCK